MYSKKFRNAGLEVIAHRKLKKDFVSQIADINPDLIISDVVRPGIDGIETLEALRADERTRNIPFVFLSNTLPDEIISKAKKLGVIDCISKGATIPSEVTEKIVNIISRLCEVENH